MVMGRPLNSASIGGERCFACNGNHTRIGNISVSVKAKRSSNRGGAEGDAVGVPQRGIASACQENRAIECIGLIKRDSTTITVIANINNGIASYGQISA